MPIATLRYSLPQEQAEYDAARTGDEARRVLNEIDQWLRSVVKYGEPTEPERKLAEHVRAMIPGEFLD